MPIGMVWSPYLLGFLVASDSEATIRGSEHVFGMEKELQIKSQKPIH